MEKFRKLGLSEHLLKALQEEGFEAPREIQEKAIPLALAGKDLIGGSATGSGKTLAFGASIVEKSVKKMGIQALILTPTRELAEQVSQAMRRFGKHKGLHVTAIYGGVAMSPQIEYLQDSEIVVGTPGRLLDHLRNGTLKLTHVKALVLDEADRMLDMGFIDDVETIISQCPKDRQTFLFSATISPDIAHIAKRHMRSPIDISGEEQVDPTKLKQVFYDVPSDQKFSLLVHLLKNDHTGLVMIFCNTQHNTDFVAQNLKNNGIDAVPIHGGLTQSRRTKMMELFKAGEVHALVCTDVAARGIDIEGVSHVYNYDSPHSSKDYIHRIGRTARAGNEGIAISIVSNRDYENFNEVLQDDTLKITQLPLPEGIERAFMQISMGRGRRFGGRENDRRSFGGGRGNSRGGGRGGGRGFGGRGGGSSRFGAGGHERERRRRFTDGPSAGGSNETKEKQFSSGYQTNDSFTTEGSRFGERSFRNGERGRSFGGGRSRGFSGGGDRRSGGRGRSFGGGGRGRRF